MKCFRIPHPREAAHEVARAPEHNPDADADAVSDWERQRLLEHS